MKTMEIKKSELNGKKPICYGYKAMKWDGGTHQSFRYGKLGGKLIGKVFTVDGKISECKWGLHFSKDPAYVFNFYEPLGHNRYFKVAAYDEVVDSKDGFKSVAQTIEFVEEYDLMQFVEIIKRFKRSGAATNRSTATNNSDATNNSVATNESTATNESKATNWSTVTNWSTATNGSVATNWSVATNESEATNNSDATNNSKATNWSEATNRSVATNRSWATNNSKATNMSDATNRSWATNRSEATNRSWGVKNCTAVSKCIFCHKLTAQEYALFNRWCTKPRYEEVFARLCDFGWAPNWANWYDIKGDKEWWAFCFPQLQEVDNKTAWSKMPQEMKDYIFSLPEFDKQVWDAITG